MFLMFQRTFKAKPHMPLDAFTTSYCLNTIYGKLIDYYNYSLNASYHAAAPCTSFRFVAIGSLSHHGICIQSVSWCNARDGFPFCFMASWASCLPYMSCAFAMDPMQAQVQLLFSARYDMLMQGYGQAGIVRAQLKASSFGNGMKQPSVFWRTPAIWVPTSTVCRSWKSRLGGQRP